MFIQFEINYRSHGTFGFWGAFLSGGHVVAPVGYYKLKNFLIEGVKGLRNWKLLWDPCFEDGKGGVVKKECAQEVLNRKTGGRLISTPPTNTTKKPT